VFPADVYVDHGLIAGFGGPDFPPALESVDARGSYLAPGFIDAHVHIESSHVSPAEFSRLVVPHGTTTVVADPHEICNVCGLGGFDYMLQATENLPLQVFLQFPSCVPCTPFENAGAVLNAPEVRQRIGQERVLGLGEMMNYVGVCAGDGEILDKIQAAQEAGKMVDGHSPGLTGANLDAYIAAGVSTDHECSTPEELRSRVRRGMYVLLREGTATKDVLRLLPAVDEGTFRQCTFCTDDRQSADLVMEGHLDNALRIAISHGLDPVMALAMATYNAANCYGLHDRGAVVPGRRADLVLFQDLRNLWVDKVWVAGELVANAGAYLKNPAPVEPKNVSGRMNVKNFSAQRLRLPLEKERVRTIRIIPHSVVTETGHAQVTPSETGEWVRSDQDIVKLAVVERHKGTGNVGIGLLEGFGLRGGAIATSVAHDSHNIIVAGDSDRDMELAVQRLVEMGGGMALVKDGVVLDSLAHEIAGLMTEQSGEQVARRLAQLGELAHEALGVHAWVDAFMTLCFMALPVIPELKITDMGLFDVEQFCHVSVEE
jgi:adenine deaminase